MNQATNDDIAWLIVALIVAVMILGYTALIRLDTMDNRQQRIEHKVTELERRRP